MKYLWKKLDVASFLTAIYAGIVCLFYFYLYITQKASLNVLFFFFVLCFFYFLFLPISKKLNQMEGFPGQVLSRNKKILTFALVSVLTFLFLMIWFIAYYPGAFSEDSINQYTQAITGNYNDWHPVWHTLLFFTLPLKLFGKPSAIILLQILYFSLLIGYMALTICELWNIKAALFSVVYIVMNPYTCVILLFPWKDVAFGMGALLCTILSVQLALKEKVPSKNWKLLLLGVFISSTTVFRHNAILFTATLLVALFFWIDKKSWIKILLFSCVSLFIIKIPIYHILNVEKPDQRVIETTGLPLTVIGNVAKETPYLMDDKLSDFVYTMASPEQWANNYNCGNFNSIKWSGINTSIVEEEGLLGMLKLMFKCFHLSTNASLQATFALTDTVYGFETGLKGDVQPYIADSSLYEIHYPPTHNQSLLDFIYAYTRFIDTTVFKYLRTYGITLLVMLFITLSRMHFKSWISWKKAFFVLPIFLYDFGTMLLLTGPDSRFFYVTFLVAPLIITVTMHKKEE